MALPHSASQTPNTIWAPISEDRFLRKVQEVRAVFAQVPGEACSHDQKSGQANFEDHVLPYNLEYQLAQDIAFIAAREEGVHTVSAATVERETTEQSLTFTIASNSGVELSVKEGILGIGRCLERCAQKGNVAAALLGYSLRCYADARTTAPGVHRDRFSLCGATMRTSDHWQIQMQRLDPSRVPYQRTVSHARRFGAGLQSIPVEAKNVHGPDEVINFQVAGLYQFHDPNQSAQIHRDLPDSTGSSAVGRFCL